MGEAGRVGRGNQFNWRKARIANRGCGPGDRRRGELRGFDQVTGSRAAALSLNASVMNYRWLSMNAVSCALGSAPTLVATSSPPLNSISVGMPRMPN